MVRSSSAEPAKPKRKGTRSVSTLTPSQLARKRANDREAQRAIRARTKEHIDRLERELQEHRSRVAREEELLRRIKVLEEQLRQKKESFNNVSMTPSPYSTPVYDDNISTGSGAIPSPRTSPFPQGDYTGLPDYGQPYVPLHNNCETWASTVSCAVHSNVSSPSSSANTDDFGGAGYIPTSVPTSILPSSNTSNTNVNTLGGKDIKMEYDDLDQHAQHTDPAFRLSNPPLPPHQFMQPHQPPHQQQVPTPPLAQQPPPQHQWNVYPMYYPQTTQSPVH